MTPAMMGPFGAGLGAFTTTVVVSLGAAEVVDGAVVAFWAVGEAVGVVEDVTEFDVKVELDTDDEELDNIVSGHVERSQASTEQQPVNHWQRRHTIECQKGNCGPDDHRD
jgi:hypothetical protein